MTNRVTFERSFKVVSADRTNVLPTVTWLCKWALNELWYGRYDSCPVTLIPIPTTAHDKMRSGADLNGDNLLISRAYLRISDHCRVTVRVRDRVRTRRIKVRFGLGFGFGLGLGLGL